MSQFVPNLNAQREALGLEVKDVAAELNRRGFAVAYPTELYRLVEDRARR